MVTNPTNPFSYRQAGVQWEITAERGTRIALCDTEVDARFLTLSANYFERLFQMLKLCRGEYEIHTFPTRGPAYAELVALHDELEAELRKRT